MGYLMNNIFKILIPIFIAIIFIAFYLFFYLIIKKSRDKKDNYKSSDYKAPYIQKQANEAENIVNKYLENMICNKLKNKGKLFKNFCFYTDENKKYSVEIDHLLVTKAGIFVIETKGHKGKIYYDKNKDIWYSNDYKEFKINPILQNKNHIEMLKKKLNNTAVKIFSIIIFPYADISDVKKHIKFVYDIEGALDFIETKSINSQNNYDFVTKISKKIDNIYIDYHCSKEEHKKNCNHYY